MIRATTACNPDMDEVHVGARKRLDWERGVVEVTYWDELADDGNGAWRSVEMCPDGAVALAKELRRWAAIVSNTGTARRAR